MKLTQNLKRFRYIYIAASLCAVIASFGIYFLADVLGVSVKILTRDPFEAAQAPPYYGYISLLGSTIWLVSGASTLAVGLFAMRVFHARLPDESNFRIIVIGGLIGLTMALDDILLIHDVIPDVTRIPELFFHGFYLLCILVLIAVSRSALLSTPWILFFLSLASLAVSSAIEFISAGQRLEDSEDIFKFTAILLWAAYFAQVCWAYMGDAHVRLSAPQKQQ